MRDSWHAGVPYGRFDPDRLISGLTAVIHPETEEIAMGLEHGAIHTAEGLLLARFFMYSQVYLHDVRRVYDLHLKEFLQAWLPGGKFSSDWQDLIKITDHEVLVALREALNNKDHQHHELAARVLGRKHFRTVYELVAPHKTKNPRIFTELLAFLEKEFGRENVRDDKYGPKSETNVFPVLMDDGSVENSLQVSGVIANVPPVDIGLIFVAPEFQDEAQSKIREKVRSLLANEEETINNGGPQNGV